MPLIFIVLFFITACSSVEKAPEAPPKVVFSELDHKLYEAVQRNNLELVKDLLIQGANPKVVGIIEDTLFHEAVQSKAQISMLEILLEAKVPLDQKNAMDITPFARAMTLGEYRSARWLLKHGANVNQRDMFETPILFNLIEKNEVEGMRLMMEYRACPYGVSFIDKPLKSITPESLKQEVQEYVDFYREKISPYPPAEWQKEDGKK